MWCIVEFLSGGVESRGSVLGYDVKDRRCHLCELNLEIDGENVKRA
jgi:DNA polymerase III alpha subunit (gram-positive type)